MPAGASATGAPKTPAIADAPKIPVPAILVTLGIGAAVIAGQGGGDGAVSSTTQH